MAFCQSTHGGSDRPLGMPESGICGDPGETGGRGSWGRTRVGTLANSCIP